MFSFKEEFKCLKSDGMCLRLAETYGGNEAILPFYFYDIYDGQNARVGKISIRIGDNFHSYYNGHIGYEVDEPYCGKKHSLHASRLVLQVARAHGMERIYITSEASNAASRRMIELLGAALVEVTPIPPECFFYQKGIEDYAVYELDLVDSPADELGEMGVPFAWLEKMRKKDGVSLFRVVCGDETYVMKCFEKAEYRREIRNYEILQALGIPALRVVARTEKSLLLEDLTKSGQYRLATEEDMSDETVARGLAKWYRALHDKGAAYVRDNAPMLYMETDNLSADVFRQIAVRTGTENNDMWASLTACWEKICAYAVLASKTLTYNDFYYTNMAVMRDDGGDALMFDYNLLGRGYAYADVRNVCVSLSEKARTAFLAAYGAYDLREKRLDDVLSVLATLSAAGRFDSLPKWADESLAVVRNGMFAKALDELIRFLDI